MQWGLTALEAVERDASPRGLALAAARRGLALARPDATSDPFCPVVRPGIVPDLVELHLQGTLFPSGLPSPSTRTRCLTLLIMPRTAGVSSRTRRRCRLFNPSPFRV